MENNNNNSPLKEFAESFKDVTGAVKVPTEIVKAVAQPAANEIGHGLADLVYNIFAKVKYKRAEHEANIEKFKHSIVDNLSEIPQENLVEPRLSVVGPAIEASTYYIEEEELREMFAKLIASASNSEYVDYSLPAFVEIIKQLSAFDAKILTNLKSINDDVNSALIAGSIRIVEPSGFGLTIIKDFIPLDGLTNNNDNIYSTSLDNLQRLGLIRIQHGTNLREHFYSDLEEHQIVTELRKELEEIKSDSTHINFEHYKNREILVEKSSWDFTNFGTIFLKACV